MVWTDEARRAALEARRAKSGGGSGGGSHGATRRKYAKKKGGGGGGGGTGNIPRTITEVMQATQKLKDAALKRQMAQRSPAEQRRIDEATRARIAEVKAREEKRQTNPTKGDRLKNVAAVYGKGSPQYRQARKTLFGGGRPRRWGR